MTNAVRKFQQRHVDATQMVNIRDKVYVAVGYDASYMSMIVGPESIVVIDAGQNPFASASIMAKFREITDKPLAALILTHSHPDHTGGAGGVLGMEKARDPKSAPAVWSRANYGSEFWLNALLPQAFGARGARQFGTLLPPEKTRQALGPSSFPDPGKDWPIIAGPVRPTHTFDGASHRLDIPGLNIELLSAPGETTDHLCVWMPDDKIAFSGDNIYGSFPNLYAVRGSGYRDVAAWADAVRLIRDLKPTVLIMGHSAPLQTPELCDEWLTNYHEAIRYVFDSTIQGINNGLCPDDLADTIKLPAHLAEKEYLTEYYGNIAWSVRSIFAGHLGWFDGEARKLAPLPRREEAARMVELAGGAPVLLERATAALAKPVPDDAVSDPEAAWAAQLSTYCVTVNPDNTEARDILATSLERLAQVIPSTTGCNYLMTSAQELKK